MESPSLGVGNGQLLRDTNDLLVAPDRTFIGAGDSEFPSEQRNRGYVSALGILERHLNAALQNPSKVKTVISKGANHSIAASSRRLEQALSFLFGS
ncbi:MAG TPA: hypothetical protein VMS40_05795 [Vicinamibacterales bacterium]|nr:hypothetical protein [Vicinamibacterales bacterium]